ncbi:MULTISPECIES: APC family permease [unclassified Acidiphilium]|uniref:APC family permease n=1 Tax=unclassified Acidiphilium TaxID=2617493 RepID=UPI000BDBAB03|nr:MULTISPECIES: APC family permease [unclassified Acidiphilium]OYV55961.1 MAG: amino acid permease [Acidiphilium sp. 20-67-58]HQT61561.1 APC family permease [Acidiphilium sp.]
MSVLGSHHRLKRDALGLPQIVASTLANIAPAMSFFFGFGLIVSGAGVAAPLTILVAMVVVLFLTNTLAEFSKYRPSTGSFVTFIGMAFGPAAGAAASIFVVFGYVVAASSVVVISGGWAHDTLKLFLGLNIPWQLLSLLETGLVGILVSRGVALSTTWAAVFFYFELALLLIGAITMLVVNAGHLSLAPFEWSHLSGGLKGIGLGFPIAIYLFIGWENSATLAEETRDARRNIPRALIIGTLSIGILYMFLAYATEIAFHNNATAIGKADIPFVDAFKASAASFLIIAYLAGVTSIFSSLLGLTNSQARILFSSGREGLLPRFFGKIHPQHRTPFVAMWSYVLVALGIVIFFGWNIKPVDLFGETGSLGTIPVILTYLVTNIALPVYMLPHHRNEFNPVKHALIPILGTILMLFPLWGLIQPGQPYPYNIYPWAALGVLVLSIIYGLSLARRDPDLVQKIGSYVADEEY